MSTMRMSKGWLAGMALAVTMSLPQAQAAPVAIDTLSVEGLSLSLSLTTPPVGTVLDTGPVTVSPAVVIDMGTYQDPIVDGSVGTMTWKIYSTGPNPAPSGTVDAGTGSIDVDLSSLRLNVSGITVPSLPSMIDVALWPVTTPPTSGSYNPMDDSWSLSWIKNFSLYVQDLGTVEGDIDLTLNGTLTTVPVPAAVWLFGSGLVGLAGVARRKKAA